MNSISTVQRRFFADRNTEYQPNEVITIQLPPSECALLHGRESFLRCIVNLVAESGNPVPANLDPAGAGAHSIIDYIQILDGSGTTVLEELTNYSQWTGTHHYYSKCQGVQQKHELFEGVAAQTMEPSIVNAFSPYFSDGSGSVEYQQVEVCLPIYMSGILYGDRSFPAIAVNGLQIKIYLNDAARAVQVAKIRNLVTRRDGQIGLPSVDDLRHLPAYNSTVRPNAGPDLEGGPLGYALQAATNLATTGTVDALEVLWKAGAVGLPDATVGPSLAANDYFQSADNSNDQRYVSGIRVGMHLGYVDDTGTTQSLGAITGIAASTTTASNIEFKFAPVTPGGTLTATKKNPVFVFIPDGTRISYRVNQVEFMATCVNPPPAYFKTLIKQVTSESGYSIDIRSFNTTLNNLQKSSVQQQELIPLTAQRARGMLMQMYRPVNSITFSYFQPVSDNLYSYQHVINDKQIPNLPVLVDKEYGLGLESWNALADDERMKLLRACKIDVRRETTPANRFCFGRRLALQGHAFNANKTQVRTTVRFGVTQQVGGNPRVVAAQNDKILATFLCHFRRIVCKPTSCSVMW